MNLIVVESPTKARTLSRFLGKEYFVEATIGHVKDLPKSKLGIDIARGFEPSYDIVADKKKNIEKIKKKSKRAKNVFLATDPDREGEAIAAHIREEIEDGKTKRIVFHEITKRAVEQAIENPRDIDRNLVDAQIARRVLDRLVGYKLSPLLWKKVRRGLSAGRVQTVAVRLIAEREREIEKFKPEEYWEIYCEVKTQNSRRRQSGYGASATKLKAGDLIVRLIKVGEEKADIKDGKSAMAIVSDLKKAQYFVFDVKKKEVQKKPYPPFTTSTLTQAAAKLYFWPAKRTMSIAQRLYEVGLITYHRTDSTNLSKLALKMARDYIKKQFGENYLPPKVVIYRTKSKVAQEAHEAIRPTKARTTKEKLVSRKSLTNDHKKLYDLIWRRFVACQMTPSVYDETQIEVLAQKEKKEYYLGVKGQAMKFDGWRKVFGGFKNQEQQLPVVKKGDPLQLIKVDPHQKFTEPPPRYGEASLVKTLEKLGIGRPSTYAPIISTIQIRNYVEKVEGKFHPTPVGFTVNDFLVKYFPEIFDYQFTAEMEGDLDNVANGERKWAEMMRDFYNPFEEKLEKVTVQAKRVKIEAEKLGKACPKCKKGELVVRIGRFGKFVSCSRFPDCDYSEKYIQKIGVKCPECGKGDVVLKTTRKGKKFYGCSRFPDCKWASWKKPKSS